MSKKRETQFDEIVRSHTRGLMAYARSITSNQWVAEEAVQETFIRAWRYWPTFRHESSVMSWLVTICRHAVTDIVRKQPTHDQLPENVIDAHDQFFTSSIFELVKGLPLPQRDVVVLCAVLGFDYESAATSLQIPIGTVRSRLARAREQLGKQLDDALAV